MKKKSIYILLIISILVIHLFVLKNDTKTFKIGRIKYAVSVNGTKENNFPSKDSYNVSVSCEGADGEWNYQEWVAEVSNITGSVLCTLEFNSTTKTTLNNYIINLLGTNTSVSSTSNDDGSTLEKVNSSLETGNTSTDYRYRGNDPNNYIFFNDELWRIIGVFDQYSHGRTGKNLVKIVKEDSIGSYVWNSSDGNDFSTSSIYRLLNEGYYNGVNGTNTNYCYNDSYSTPSIANCNFTGIGGIQDDYRDMIEPVTWYLGGSTSYEMKVTSADMYKYERSTSSSYYYSGNSKTVSNTPIGLLYASDFGYAAPSSCTGQLYSYRGTVCINNNWSRKSNGEYLITHFTENPNYVFKFGIGGTASYGFTYNSANIRPTLYLDSSVYYLSGIGSQVDPYIIAM